METSQPYLDTKAPYMETSQPYLDTKTPYMETTQPYMDTPQPYLDTKAPYMVTRRSNMQTSQPYLDTKAPYMIKDGKIWEDNLNIDKNSNINKTPINILQKHTKTYNKDHLENKGHLERIIKLENQLGEIQKQKQKHNTLSDTLSDTINKEVKHRHNGKEKINIKIKEYDTLKYDDINYTHIRDSAKTILPKSFSTIPKGFMNNNICRDDWEIIDINTPSNTCCNNRSSTSCQSKSGC
jgi:hypothetical protein